MNVYEKLQKARIKLQELNLRKSGKNKFSGFSYYELSDFLPSINKIFDELKLCGGFSAEEKKAQLTIVNCEKPDEVITFVSPTKDVELKGCTGIQGIGAAHTYMRRYLYMNALEIVENDELDAKAGAIQELADHEKEISEIGSVEELNATYKRFKANPPKDDNWKRALQGKAEYLRANFDKAIGEFYVVSFKMRTDECV